ncbi:MAG: hypothetical protein KDI55_06970 [Anaerolineae bacterium]|nr:hypothetical protein [Anaerolineae bacterium]
MWTTTATLISSTSSLLPATGIGAGRGRATAAVAPGQRLAAAGAGQARGLRQVQIAGVAVDESAPTLGIAVDAPDPITGLAPVMVSLR